MDPVALLLFLVLLLILIFFAGTEIPLMSVSDHTVDIFVKQHRFGAIALRRIRKESERLLVTNLIGTTAVTIAISSFSTIVAIDLSHEMSFPGELGVTIAMLFVSGIILLIGEIAPKIIGVRFSDEVALMVAPAYRALMILLLPLNWIIEYFIKFVSFVTGAHVDLHGKKMTSEEFEAFIDIGHKKGAVETHEHRKIKSILDLDETEAGSVMTPRVKVDFVHCEATVDQVCKQFLTSSHTRLPVYCEDQDDVEHVVTFREAFTWQSEGKGASKLSELDLEKIIRVPLTQPIDTVFEIFQKSHKHIALVLDEHGGVAGVITLEDIVEEVFGDIKDEHDREEIFIRRRGNGSLAVKGSVLVDDVLDELGLTHEDVGMDEEYLGETVGYLIISVLERFPENGECIRFTTGKVLLTLCVKDISDGKVEDVEVRKG